MLWAGECAGDEYNLNRKYPSVPTPTLRTRSVGVGTLGNLLFVFRIHKRLTTSDRESAFDPEH